MFGKSTSEATTSYRAQNDGAGATGIEEGRDEFLDDESSSAPRGHLCCGGLCDMRIGTVAANIMDIVLKTVMISFDLSWGELYPTVLAYSSLLLSVIAIFSALNFEPFPGWMASLGFALLAVVHIVFGAEWYAIVFDFICLYPTAILAYQLQRGIVTRENYKRWGEYLHPCFRPLIDKYCI